jgi:hypothetical protein
MREINELKQMQQCPTDYLSKYFYELKLKVDSEYALKLDEKDKYLEIINSIESFEQDAYNKLSSKPINTYENEIKLIEEKFNNNKNVNLIDILDSINELTYKIEKSLFSNKSILYIDKNSRFKFNINSSFLLIINDEYISE